LNIRYIAELTKFRITPQHVVFHCLKVLLEDFSHANIELIAQMLEGCGRFLYASSDTATQMAAMVFNPHASGFTDDSSIQCNGK
jgi:regulator of nonsense transcripts 2